MQAQIQGQDNVATLVRQAQDGGAAAFSALYEHYYDSIFRYVSFRTGSTADAEDITAEVFVRMNRVHSPLQVEGLPVQFLAVSNCTQPGCGLLSQEGKAPNDFAGEGAAHCGDSNVRS